MNQAGDGVQGMERSLVSFVLDAGLARAVLAALRGWRQGGGGDAATLDRVLGLARAQRLSWRRDTLTVLEAGRRDALLQRLRGDAADPDALALLAAAPTQVRSFCLTQAEQHSARLERLTALNAPAVVLRGTRRVVEAALRGLDPAGTLEPDQVDDGAGDEAPSLHVWLDEVLRCARGQDAAVEVRPLPPAPPPPPSGEDADDDLMAQLAAGHESTTLGMRPSRRFWLPAEARLPHLGDAGVASGLGGGPASFAFRGDAPEALAPILRARLAALSAAQALLAFVWVPNDVEVGWDDLSQ